MNIRHLFIAASLAAALISLAAAQEAKKTGDKTGKSAAQPEFKLPPGWTEADMQACMLAGTPGEMHKKLAADAGVWVGKNTMWMAPGAEPMVSDSKTTVTPILDGRFVRLEMAGEMPGMGPYNGFAISGATTMSARSSLRPGSTITARACPSAKANCRRTARR
jgi:hypothetical protein